MRIFSDNDGMPVVKASENPISDTLICEVEYPDWHKALLAANFIAENIFYLYTQW